MEFTAREQWVLKKVENFDNRSIVNKICFPTTLLFYFVYWVLLFFSFMTMFFFLDIFHPGTIDAESWTLYILPFSAAFSLGMATLSLQIGYYIRIIKKFQKGMRIVEKVSSVKV